MFYENNDIVNVLKSKWQGQALGACSSMIWGGAPPPAPPITKSIKNNKLILKWLKKNFNLCGQARFDLERKSDINNLV